jgi:sugar phosphate isomerase/epimerase
MKLGVCTSPDQLATVYTCGYDYIEANFGWLTTMSDEDYAANTALVEASPIKVEAFNCFFNGSFPIYAADGDQTDILPQVAAYCEKGFARAAAWGGKIAVIGSGGVRRIPDGMTKEQIDPQFARVLAVCGEVAQKYGMRVVVEPLCYKECNYVNLVSEGAELAKLSGHPAVGGLVDFYHHGTNGESLETLPESADLLYHSHYGRPIDRIAPQPGIDEAYLADVAAALRKCPHLERMSLECGLQPDFETGLKIARPLLEEIKQI